MDKGGAQMKTERVSSPNQIANDDKMHSGLRPTALKGYIGQKHLIETLITSITAAKKRNEPLDHVLLYGPPGLGKTSLAQVIANEIGTSIICTSGPSLKKTSDLIGILTNLKPGAVLFIDEIHGLPTLVEEFLYSAMEDFKIDFVIGEGMDSKSLVIKLNKFTLIGATTRAGMLSAPLRDRFSLVHHMEFYDHQELVQIIQRSGSILNMKMDAIAAMEIAVRSRGTPRIANRLLKRVRDYAEVNNNGVTDLRMVDEALTREGIDQMGLDRLDKQYLAVLVKNYLGSYAGVDAIASIMNEEVETLEEVVEPYLLKLGLIIRTKQGRTLSQDGLEAIKSA